jgi:hypothetical protein
MCLYLEVECVQMYNYENIAFYLLVTEVLDRAPIRIAPLSSALSASACKSAIQLRLSM